MTRCAPHGRTFLPVQSFSVGPCRLCLSGLAKAGPCRVSLTMTLHLIHAHLLLTRNHPCPVNLPPCPFLDVPRTTPTEPLGGVGLGRGWGCPRFIISTSTSRPRRPRPHPPGGYPSAAALGPEGGSSARPAASSSASGRGTSPSPPPPPKPRCVCTWASPCTTAPTPTRSRPAAPATTTQT